ncbi:germination protein, Ger(x)C family [Halobacillus alkaliphilus]|uniref:Germination protein, Ger(X)C family n=1 Tax=Halobacillus alkaliphilus TaxID=396056 RepID=A0A1I2JXU3_9BACI|nr:Ger(x)C family spore germination protein [Halobacillus alkaliphilus]SFF57651.1 germination protein, Ger(x)C family [Halobacillus alkaliphilus]
MKHNPLFHSLLVLTFFLTGCLPHKSIEDAALVDVAAFDLIDEEKIKGTMLIPQFIQDETGGVEEKHISSVGESVQEIYRNVESKSSKPLRMGKVSMIFFGDELAKKDISRYIDFLQRDPDIGREVYLGVVAGNAEDLIKGKYSKTEPTGEYIEQLMEQNTTKYIPTQNLQKFLYAYYSDGMDPSLPYFQKEGKEMKLAGYVFFDKNKMVYSIPFSEAFVLKLLSQDFKNGLQPIEYKDHQVALENIGSKVKYRIKGDKNNPEFHINLKVNGMVGEIVPANRKIATKELEKAFKDYFTEHTTQLIQEFQENNIDPLGLGEVIKNRHGNFDPEKWKEKYPNIPVKVNVSVRILEKGIAG